MISRDSGPAPEDSSPDWSAKLQGNVRLHGEPPTIPLDRLVAATLAPREQIEPEERSVALSNRAGFTRLCTEVAFTTDEVEPLDAMCDSILQSGQAAHREFLGLLLTYSPDPEKRYQGATILISEGAPSAYGAGVRLMRSSQEFQPLYLKIALALDLISLRNDLGNRELSCHAQAALTKVQETSSAGRRQPQIVRNMGESVLEKYVVALATNAGIDQLKAAAENLAATGDFPEFREASAGYLFGVCGKKGPSREELARLDTILRAGTLAGSIPNGNGIVPSRGSSAVGNVLQFPLSPDRSRLAADEGLSQKITDPAGVIEQIAWSGTRPEFLTLLEAVPSDIRTKILPRVALASSAASATITFAPDRGFGAPVRPFYQGDLPLDSAIGRFKQNLIALADAGFAIGDCRDRRSWGLTKEGTIVCLDYRSLHRLDADGIADEKARIAQIRVKLL